MKLTLRTAVLAAAAALIAQSAAAETLTFGTPLSGTGPTVDFATLTYTQTGDGDDWTFTLAAQDLATLFSSAGAFIGSVAVDTPDSVPGFGSGLAMTNVSGGVTSVEARNGGGPGGVFDFRFALGQGAGNRLTSGETVTWTWNDSGLQSFTQLALHVQGLEGNGQGYSNSIWYIPTTPVPEPATLAMMLAGAGLIGVARRRRRS